MQTVSCQHLRDFLKTELEVIQKHLDEHKYLRHIDDKEAATMSFIEDYGWLMRELYCTQVCDLKNECHIAIQLNKEGDLLRNRVKE